MSYKGNEWDKKRLKEEDLKKFMKIAIEQFEKDKNKDIDINFSLSLYETKCISELLMILRKQEKGFFGR